MIRSIREKLSVHYAKAGEISQAEYERQQKTVEQVTMRNNAFILHALEANQKHRSHRPHENSPVNQAATLEDEIDILMSLEPSIATSSVRPQSEDRLFSNRFFGVILGGGDIESARGGDAATNPRDIKNRPAMERDQSPQVVDAEISSTKTDSYNELVVNNAKISGIFHKVSGPPTQEGIPVLAFISPDSVESFRGAMDLARRRGVPQYVLTPENRMFEYISVGDDGSISLGNELQPTDIAKRPDGLTDEKRLEAGERVLEHNILKDFTHQQEAKAILGEISGQSYELTKEDYLQHLRAFPEEAWKRLRTYPEEIAKNRSMIEEATRLDPKNALSYVNFIDSGLKHDKEYLKFFYDCLPSGERHEQLWSLPREVIDKELVLYALEHNDTGNNISTELYEDPEIKQKILEGFVANFKISDIDKRKMEEDHDSKVYRGTPLFTVTDRNGKDISFELGSEPELIVLLNEKFEGQYTFEYDPSHEHLVITAQ